MGVIRDGQPLAGVCGQLSVVQAVQDVEIVKS